MENDRPRRRANNIDGFIVPENKSYKPSPKRREDIRLSQKPTIENRSLLNTPLPGRIYPSSPISMKTNQESSKPKKKRSKKKIVLLSVLAIFLIAIGAAGWDAWQLYHKLHRLNVGNLTASVGGAENILVAGSTNRCNLKVQNSQWGFCSQGVTGVNSDIIFIVHLVPSTHQVSLLSIPRDTFIPNARKNYESFKIDAALYQGPSQLVAAVEQDFGIPIQHYAEVGFDGFVNIVNAVGGVKVDFPMPVYDHESYLNVTEPGCHKLNGVQALQVVRARHLQYKPASVTTNNHYYWPQEGASDIARIERTHEFLKILASTVVSRGIDNPISDQKLIDAIAPQAQIDSGFSTSTMLTLLSDFHRVSINSVPQYTLPVVTPNFGAYTYEGENMGDVIFPLGQTDQQVINKFLGTSSSTNTMTGKPLPKAQSIAVNVINGSGVSNQATTISNGLRKLGFNLVGQPTTATPVSTQAQETVVYYANKSSEGDALQVASKLNGYVILAQNPNKVTSGSDVTVITGTNASVIGQSSTNSSSSASVPSATSTKDTTTSYGSVNAAIPQLAAWDPRACSVNQPIVPNNANL